jgi:hypothetical protein
MIEKEIDAFVRGVRRAVNGSLFPVSLAEIEHYQTSSNMMDAHSSV